MRLLIGRFNSLLILVTPPPSINAYQPVRTCPNALLHRATRDSIYKVAIWDRHG